MIKYIIALLLPFALMCSCVEDNSAYDPQEKEDIVVDDVTPEDGGEDVEPEPGILVPGLHLVKINVLQPDGQTVERSFKYFVPISIDALKPIPLIFEFHGSYAYEAEMTPPNPIEEISNAHQLCQHAIKENCVIVFPAGEDVKSDEGGSVNWQNSENHLPFVDDMVDYFKNSTPTIDANRIYSTGQSSGAIFSFVLAFKRSEIFAAITPRAGQMNIDNETEMPERAVPVRVFAGIDDDIVQHSAVITNMTAWAEKIGGYFESDMKYTQDSIEVANYKKIDTRIWSEGNADLQIFSIQDEGHSINLSHTLPYMWEFMKSRTLENTTPPCFLTSELQTMNLQCGQQIEFSINHSDGASVNLENIPKGWTIILEGKTVKVAAPVDFFADVQRDGTLDIIAKKDGQEASLEIRYKLIAPKTYFDVGDYYYSENFEIIGVVCWVNNANISEAKIINIDVHKSMFYCGNGSGLGLTFSTPDKDNGDQNTQSMLEFNNTLATPFTAANAAFMWASNLNYKGSSDWYLPAINELAAIAPNVSKINEAIKLVGGAELKAAWGDLNLYSSTTEVKEGAAKKTFYNYNFKTNSIVEKLPRDNGSEYFGYINVRAIKKVTK